jgi:hypothetical protein
MERLDDFGYPDIPRVYEEALALYAALEPGRRISLHGRTVREETLRRLYQFTTDLGVYERGDDSEKKRTYEKLVRDFGDSYFFFWQFGYTEPQPGWKMKEPPERGAPK